jgi:hypothetical protein
MTASWYGGDRNTLASAIAFGLWEWFEHSYALDSTQTWLPLYIGVTERTMGDDQRAEEMLRRGLEAEPDSGAFSSSPQRWPTDTQAGTRLRWPCSSRR